MIFLVNMPFAALTAPSIGLSQLKAALAARQPVEGGNVRILYLNHDFALFLNDKTFYSHAMSNYGFSTGVGDWFFKQAAFPDADDRPEDYLSLYYPGEAGVNARVRALAQTRRLEINQFLDEMIEKYDLARAGVVGFTSIFSQTTASLAMARKLKSLNPNIVTLMGGAACSGEMGLALARNCDMIDYFFSGCGLSSFPEFIECHARGDREACERIDGVLTRTNVALLKASGDDVAAGGVGLFGAEPDINLTPKPDYTDFLEAFESSFPDSNVEPRLLFETSRGCWWGERSHCRFCGLNGPCIRFRAMLPDVALDHLRSVLQYSGRCSFFASVDNILPPEYFAEVMPHIRLKPGQRIQYEVRANLDGEQIDTLCRAGVTLIQPGIESLSSESLRLMGKGLSAFDNIRFLKACSRHPVSLGWNLLIFVPGEAEETYQRYIDLFPLLSHLHPPLAVYPIEFVRYSEYVEHPEKYGLSLCPEPFYSMIYPFDEQTISGLAHKFMNTRADPEKIRWWMTELTRAINSWRARWLNSDGQEQARLCLIEDDDETVVYDSRGGAASEYPLSHGALKILRFLENARTIDEVEAGVGGIQAGLRRSSCSENGASVEVPGLDVSSEVAALLERGLLFEENGRLLSLVVM